MFSCVFKKFEINGKFIMCFRFYDFQTAGGGVVFKYEIGEYIDVG